MTTQTVTYKEAEPLLNLIADLEWKQAELEKLSNMVEDQMKEIWEALN